MNNLTPEQLSAAGKANLETLFGLTNKAVEGLEKLIELNMQVVRATLADSAENAKAMMSVKDVQELLALQASMLKPSTEKVAAYARHLYEIATSTGSEVTKVAEAQLGEVQRNVMSAVDSAMKNAPAGTESTVSLVKSALSAANNAYESVSKAAKQAADMTEANLKAVTDSAVKASQAAAQSAKR